MSMGMNGEVNNVTLLNSRYTFDSFVSYGGNMVAHAASVAIAEQAAKAYNPLFLYGGAGLGKTHLMHAVGNYVIAQRPMTKVVYISSEKFTNEFVNSIRDDRMNEFRDRYRKVDLLLLDDVQFFGRRERAQEELFHTFNELYEANKKIVLSSDKKPSEIPMIEERLSTRFEWGLTADIQPPDYETRVAILRKKAQIQDIDMPDEIMNYIAELIPQNIRKLEGALNKVVAYSSVTGYQMDISLAEEALKEIISKEAGREITSGLVIDVVSRYFSLNDDDFISSKKRNKEIVFPRQVAMYLCRELVGLSLPNIGNLFGGRDHSTVLYAINKVKDEMLVSGDVKRMIEDLMSDIKGDG
jgi:chromosomal replication initiator protein